MKESLQVACAQPQLKGFRLYYAKSSISANWNEREQNADRWHKFSDQIYSKNQVNAIISVCRSSCSEFIFVDMPIYRSSRPDVDLMAKDEANVISEKKVEGC